MDILLGLWASVNSETNKFPKYGWVQPVLEPAVRIHYLSSLLPYYLYILSNICLMYTWLGVKTLSSPRKPVILISSWPLFPWWVTYTAISVDRPIMIRLEKYLNTRRSLFSYFSKKKKEILGLPRNLPAEENNHGDIKFPLFFLCVCIYVLMCTFNSVNIMKTCILRSTAYYHRATHFRVIFIWTLIKRSFRLSYQSSCR